MTFIFLQVTNSGVDLFLSFILAIDLLIQNGDLIAVGFDLLEEIREFEMRFSFSIVETCGLGRPTQLFRIATNEIIIATMITNVRYRQAH